MTASRRDLIRAMSAGAASLSTRGDTTNALAQDAPSPCPNAEHAPEQSETQPWLDQFEPAWRPLDPQLRAVLRMIYARLKGLPPPAQLAASELKWINAGLSFFFSAGAPALPHIEEKKISVPSGSARVRIYDPGTSAPAPTVVLLHGGGWVMGSIDTYDGFARQIA